MTASRLLQPGARFERRPDVLHRECLDGFVLYDPASERIHVLNEAARFVWQRCEPDKTLAEIVAEVSAAAGIALDVAAGHVRDALRLFLEQRLVDER